MKENLKKYMIFIPSVCASVFAGCVVAIFLTVYLNRKYDYFVSSFFDSVQVYQPSPEVVYFVLQEPSLFVLIFVFLLGFGFAFLSLVLNHVLKRCYNLKQ
nr:MAG TPA: toxin [Caudoviricetes sp.]